MDKKSKIINMRDGKKMVIPKAAGYFTILEKEHIIQEYLTSQISKNGIVKLR